MSEQVPLNFRASSDNNSMGQSSGNENIYDVQADSWFRDYFQVLGLSEQSEAGSDSKLEVPCERGFGSGQSSGTVRIQEEMLQDKKISSEVVQREQNNLSKKQRKAEVHNRSERKRRDRIKEKIKTLQELIPNCNKSNRASVLDDAVKYVKALKLQVDTASAAWGGGAIFQAPYTSPTALQPTLHSLHQLGMFHSSGVPSGMMSVPWAAACNLHPSLSWGALGFPLMSVPQLQRPYLHSEQLPASVNESTVLPANLATEFSPQFTFSS